MDVHGEGPVALLHRQKITVQTAAIDLVIGTQQGQRVDRSVRRHRVRVLRWRPAFDGTSK